MPGVVDGERSNTFHFASPRICHVINSVIGGTLGFRKSRIGQESSQESFQKERFGLLGSVSRKRSLTSKNVPNCYAAFCASSALSRRRSPVRIRSELPETPVQSRKALNFFCLFWVGTEQRQNYIFGRVFFDRHASAGLREEFCLLVFYSVLAHSDYVGWGLSPTGCRAHARAARPRRACCTSAR